MTDSSHQMNQDRETLPERVEIARKNKDNQDTIILVFLPWNRTTPFVTWVEGDDGSTYWGHYHRELRPALEDFETR